MGKQALASEPLDDATVAQLDLLCEHFGDTREHLVAAAILRFVQAEEQALPGYGAEWAQSPPFVESDPLASALNDAEAKAVTALEDYLEPAERDIAAGRTIDHEDFMREMRERYRSRDAAA